MENEVLNEEQNLNAQVQGTLNGEPADPTAEPVESVTATVIGEQKPENVVAGLVGAFLFSLIGGVAYFIIYQLGFIAGITGLITFVLANFGYQLFSGRKNSMIGIVAACVFTVLATLFAEYTCIAYEVYLAYKDSVEITFFDAFRAAWSFIVDPELDLMGPVLADVGFALLFGVFAAFGSIRTAVAASKSGGASANKQ